jgi:hypothetical protein
MDVGPGGILQVDARTDTVLYGCHDRNQVSLDGSLFRAVFEFVENVMV